MKRHPDSSPAYLLLEDGRRFEGWGFGAPGSALGEIVFNTGMTGYQEVLTDPSYSGQLVCMTYPLIGNYGVNEEDQESAGPKVSGFIVREAAQHFSSWRASESLQEGVAGVRESDLAASYPDLQDVAVEELDRQIGDESTWFRITGISDAGDLVIDDQVAFRVGSARSFLRAVSTFDADANAGRDAYLEEVAALAEVAASRIERALASLGD